MLAASNIKCCRQRLLSWNHEPPATAMLHEGHEQTFWRGRQPAGCWLAKDQQDDYLTRSNVFCVISLQQMRLARSAGACCQQAGTRHRSSWTCSSKATDGDTRSDEPLRSRICDLRTGFTASRWTSLQCKQLRTAMMSKHTFFVSKEWKPLQHQLHARLDVADQAAIWLRAGQQCIQAG